MKKEILAALVLLLLFTGALLHIQAINQGTAQILALLDASQAALEAQDHDRALAQAEAAYRRWGQSGPYAEVFLRHSEVDSATDSFVSLLARLQAGEVEGLADSYALLRAQLQRLADMEQLRLGSVF